ncbi:hypothetical protein Tco_0656774, partial [Tanacetum coccineum]
NPQDHVKSISTAEEANIPSIRRIEPTRYAVSSPQKDDKIKLSRVSVPFLSRLKEYEYDEEEVLKGLKKLQVNSAVSATSLKRLLKEKTRIKEEIKETMNEHYSAIIKDDLTPKEKDPRSFTLPCKINGLCFDKALADLGASVSVVPYLTFTKLGLGLRERMELDLEARLMGEALILNRSQDFEFEDFLELNDLNEPLELRNHENEDLDPEIKEGEIIDEPMSDIVAIRHYNRIVEKIDEYPSFCDYGRKIPINYAYILQFPCMIGYEHVNVNFFPVLSINIMSKSFYNSLMKEKIEYKWKNIVGTFINVSIFVGNFSIITDFTVMENIDAYRDNDMGDVIFRKPFFRDVGVEARWFDGFITIHNGNDNVTYQMARSHPRFKHLSNEQCNKIRPLLKVSAQDKLDGTSHPYQKLKGFYKGVLNLGSEYIKEEKMFEWLTRGHVNVHEMN